MLIINRLLLLVKRWRELDHRAPVPSGLDPQVYAGLLSFSSFSLPHNSLLLRSIPNIRNL